MMALDLVSYFAGDMLVQSDWAAMGHLFRLKRCS